MTEPLWFVESAHDRYGNRADVNYSPIGLEIRSAADELSDYDVGRNQMNMQGWDYDAAGNFDVTVFSGVSTFHYDAENRLVWRKMDWGREDRYHFDGEGGYVGEEVLEKCILVYNAFGQVIADHCIEAYAFSDGTRYWTSDRTISRLEGGA